MTKILEGKEVTAALNGEIKADVAELKKDGIVPCLAILRVGSDPDQVAYERGAVRKAEALGVKIDNIIMPEGASQQQIIEAVERINGDDSIHGVLILNPLPGYVDDNAVRNALDADKDVDGVTDASVAGVFSGNGKGYPPCTAEACMRIMDHYGISVSGKRPW